MIRKLQHRLLAITQDLLDPATRYRINLHVPSLQASGVEVAVVPWPRDKRDRWALLAEVSEFDSVVVQRRLLSSSDSTVLRKRAKWLAYDFDDAVIYRDSFHGRPWLLPDRLIRFRRMVTECDAVTAGSPYLADLASRYSKGVPVLVVPTVIDAERYESRRNTPPALPSAWSVGWIGLHTNLPYLEALHAPLRRVAQRHPGMRLVIISNTHPHMDNLPTETIEWEQESEAGMLSRIDIGLAPLADNKWTRGKCGLRLLQFLAAGIPAVATPVGTQSEIAARGACLPAKAGSEWESAVERLFNDPLLREELVAAGNALVHERFVPQVWTSLLLSAWCDKQPNPLQQ